METSSKITWSIASLIAGFVVVRGWELISYIGSGLFASLANPSIPSVFGWLLGLALVSGLVADFVVGNARAKEYQELENDDDFYHEWEVHRSGVHLVDMIANPKHSISLAYECEQAPTGSGWTKPRYEHSLYKHKATGTFYEIKTSYLDKITTVLYTDDISTNTKKAESYIFTNFGKDGLEAYRKAA